MSRKDSWSKAFTKTQSYNPKSANDKNIRSAQSIMKQGDLTIWNCDCAH